MIKCPRCGFEQPRDRFCAKCGIVIDNFVSKPGGYGATPYVLSLIVLIISGSLYYRYLYLSHPSEEERNAPVQVSTVRAPPPLPKPVSTPAPVSRVLPPSVAVTVVPTPEESPSEKAEPTTVNVDFVLASRSDMDRISQEGEGHLEIGTYSVSVVPQFKSKYSTNSDTLQKLGTETKGLTLSQPSMVFRGGKEPKRNEAIGLYVEVTPQKMVERGMEFKVSIKRSLPELSGPDDIKVVSQDYDQTMTIPKGWGAIIAGLLPRKPLLEGEDKLYETNILKAFLDPAFQKGDSEFLVVIWPQ